MVLERHLPGDGQRRHRVSLPGLRGESSPGPGPTAGTRTLRDRGGRRDCGFQPCFSPVWDTALSVGALLAADMDGNEAPVQEAMAWLLEREVTVTGDWREKSLQDAPGGWCFEYRNDLYPDCDDTAEVLLLLAAVRGRTGELETRRQAAAERGQRWLLGLQNPDGGWASFDRCCDKEVLTLIPFADHNAMIDPSTPGHHRPGDQRPRWRTATLRTMVRCDGRPTTCFASRRRMGAGRGAGAPTASTAPGLPCPRWVRWRRARTSAPAERLSRACRRGRRWLLDVQNEDGGWGESLRSYDDPGFKGLRATAPLPRPRGR